MKLRGRRSAALALLLVLCLASALRRAYPGMASGMWNEVRHGTVQENRNLWGCIHYWLGFMEKLRLDPSTGIYNFRLTPDRGLNDFDAGLLAFHRGQFARATSLIDRHLRAAGESEEGRFWLAMSSMREGETVNCLEPLLAHDHALFCSLPLRRTHDRKQFSRRAAESFARILDNHSPGASDARLYRWLLSFSAMTVGGLPGEVPEQYRIATPFVDAFYGERAERTRREFAWLRFEDRARDLGVENFGNGRGVAVEDFDNDGDLDLFTVGEGNRVRYYRNEAGARFTDLTDRVGLASAVQPFTMAAADYDGDGWMDLFVSRPFTHYQLFRNRGGTFEDVTAASGLLDAKPEGAIAATWVAAWGDVDNDGDLDLFLSQWGLKLPLVEGIMAVPRMDSKLFVNQGGRFRDATADFGLADFLADRYFIGSAFGDYDGDGWADLYLSSPLRGATALLRNERGRRFAPVHLFDRSEPGFTGSFVDYDQDGKLDLFHAGFGDARTAVEQAVFGQNRDRYETGHSTFLLQRGGRFEEHNELFGGGDMPMSTMGASYGDLDNDGCLDVYLGTGNPEPWFILPNLMYLGEQVEGRCTGRLRNISMLNGFGNVQKGHGIVFFDFDNDGDQDVFSSLGGMWPSDPWLSQMFVNESATANRWIKVRLRGRRSNRFGLGSMIEVRARAEDGRRFVRTYHMDGKTGFGSAPYLAHVGLGRAEEVEGVRVTWLGSGCVGTYRAAIGTLNVLDEADCLADCLTTGTPSSPSRPRSPRRCPRR
ncbi:MAG: hypothetical protein QOH06_705 [Acidobacteriota bacterium]|jgi:hypothetical protein|nr:hypothetical protein [Acidobacteriota bacterium]